MAAPLAPSDEGNAKIVQQKADWWGPTYGIHLDSEISGWHGCIIWTDKEFELSRGDNNEPQLAVDICRILFCQGCMPVPRWRGVKTGSEVLSEAEAAQIFAPLEGSWSLQFVEGEQLEADDDEGFNQRFLEADISSNNLTMAGGQHYSPNAGPGTARHRGKYGHKTIGPNQKLRSGYQANPAVTLDMILIRPHPSTGEPDNAYYIDGRGTILVIRSPTEMLLKPFQGSCRGSERGISGAWRAGQYDVMMTKTDNGVGKFDQMETSQFSTKIDKGVGNFDHTIVPSMGERC